MVTWYKIVRTLLNKFTNDTIEYTNRPFVPVRNDHQASFYNVHTETIASKFIRMLLRYKTTPDGHITNKNINKYTTILEGGQEIKANYRRRLPVEMDGGNSLLQFLHNSGSFLLTNGGIRDTWILNMTEFEKYEVRNGFERYGGCLTLGQDKILSILYLEKLYKPGDGGYESALDIIKSTLFVKISIEMHAIRLHLATAQTLAVWSRTHYSEKSDEQLTTELIEKALAEMDRDIEESRCDIGKDVSLDVGGVCDLEESTIGFQEMVSITHSQDVGLIDDLDQQDIQRQEELCVDTDMHSNVAATAITNIDRDLRRSRSQDISRRDQQRTLLKLFTFNVLEVNSTIGILLEPEAIAQKVTAFTVKGYLDFCNAAIKKGKFSTAEIAGATGTSWNQVMRSYRDSCERLVKSFFTQQDLYDDSSIDMNDLVNSMMSSTVIHNILGDDLIFAMAISGFMPPKLHMTDHKAMGKQDVVLLEILLLAITTRIPLLNDDRFTNLFGDQYDRHQIAWDRFVQEVMQLTKDTEWLEDNTIEVSIGY